MYYKIIVFFIILFLARATLSYTCDLDSYRLCKFQGNYLNESYDSFKNFLNINGNKYDFDIISFFQDCTQNNSTDINVLFCVSKKKGWGSIDKNSFKYPDCANSSGKNIFNVLNIFLILFITFIY